MTANQPADSRLGTGNSGIRYRVHGDPMLTIFKVVQTQNDTTATLIDNLPSYITAQKIRDLLYQALRDGITEGYKQGYEDCAAKLLNSELSLNKIEHLLNSWIEDLDLTNRAYNCLKRENIHTIADLITRTKAEVSRIRNLGDKSLEEIVTALGALGLSLRTPTSNDSNSHSQPHSSLRRNALGQIE